MVLKVRLAELHWTGFFCAEEQMIVCAVYFLGKRSCEMRRTCQGGPLGERLPGKKAGGCGKATKAPFRDQDTFGTGSLCLFSGTSAKAPNCPGWPWCSVAPLTQITRPN